MVCLTETIKVQVPPPPIILNFLKKKSCILEVIAKETNQPQPFIESQGESSTWKYLIPNFDQQLMPKPLENFPDYLCDLYKFVRNNEADMVNLCLGVCEWSVFELGPRTPYQSPDCISPSLPFLVHAQHVSAKFKYLPWLLYVCIPQC